MSKNLLFFVISLVSVGLLTSVANAQLYFCEKDGRKSLTSKKLPGAKCVIKKNTDSLSKTNSTKRNTSADRKAESTYPKVSSNEQKQRDIVRARLLQTELENEVALYNYFLGKIKDDKPSALDKELRSYYIERLQAHVENLKSLQQEIKRL